MIMNAYGAIAKRRAKGVKKKKGRRREKKRSETLYLTKRDYYPRIHALLMRLIKKKQSN